MPVYLLDQNIIFPDPRESDENGLVAVGGDLSVERLLLAYNMGIFPWYSEDQPILWFSPDPRMVIYPKEFKASKSLLKLINSGKFDLKIDRNFTGVIENCSKIKRKGQRGTWITEEMKSAYTELYNRGYAHSFEIYYGNKLVGGLYGVSIGSAFFGESMFHHVANASKVAFYYLVNICNEFDFDFIDCQIPTSHLKSLGGLEISRDKFLKLLGNSLKRTSHIYNWSS